MSEDKSVSFFGRCETKLQLVHSFVQKVLLGPLLNVRCCAGH